MSDWRSILRGLALLACLTAVAAAQQTPPPENADVNADGIVDATDLSLVQASLGKRCGQAGFNPKADVNGDCVVNVTDTAFVSRNLGLKFPPTIVATVSPAANANGWLRTNATVTFVCTRTTTCPAAVTVTTEGAGQTIDRTVSNKGGSATAHVVLNIDKTPPSATATIAPAPNAAGWINTNATVTFTCSDALSGVATCPPVANVSTEGANQSVGGTVTDKADNTANAAATLSIDKSAPAITISAPADNAVLIASPAAVAATASDPLSGIAAATCNDVPVVPGPGGAIACTVPLAAGQNTLTVAVTDRAGNRATAQRVVTYRINAAPTVSAGDAQTITLPAPATLAGSVSDDGLPVGAPLTAHWSQVSGPGTATFANAASPTTTAAFDKPGTYVLRLTASDSLLSSSADVTIMVREANTAPVVSTGGPYAAETGSAIGFDASASSDADGDAITITWDFGDGTTGQGAKPSHTYTSAGVFAVVVTANDGHGGIGHGTTTATITAALSSVAIAPALTRFSQVGASRALIVTGTFSDGSTGDLTHTPGTTYESSNTFVATVDADGTLHAVANGTATITARYKTLSATAGVAVEAGVTLTSLAISPAEATLRAIGATQRLTVQGTFTDGSTRDLSTAAAGTQYSSSAPSVVAIDENGLATAASAGDATVVARNDAVSGSAAISVVIATGTGIARGVAFDDARGLPLSGATATLVSDGGGVVDPPVVATSDDSGQFVLSAKAGPALVRIEKAGYSGVERSAIVPADAAVRLLDARLTLLDPQHTAIASAFGGIARDSLQTATLRFDPGTAAHDVGAQLTPISQQGLRGRLPFGWSPVAAIEVGPVDLALQQPAALALRGTAALPPAAVPVLAFYDAAAHGWMTLGAPDLGTDRQTYSFPVARPGQYAVLLADTVAAPAAPAGQPLAGGAPAALPSDAALTGQVVPRSAPAGPGVHAAGTVTWATPAQAPSGIVVQAHVRERFDLFDTSTSIPQPFAQDFVLFERAVPVSGGRSLSAAFPVTPSLDFTIQDLELGRVHLDVAAPAPSTGVLIGADGGSATDTAGDILHLAAGAVASRTVAAIDSLPPDQLRAGVPDGFTLASAVRVDLAAATLIQSADVSVNAGALADGTSLIVAQVVTDAHRRQHLRIVATGVVVNHRVSTQTEVAGLSLPGIRSSGDYLFMTAAAPIGFVTGRVSGTGSAQVQAPLLVTVDTAPFADLIALNGRYVVAGRSGVAATVSAVDATGASESHGTVAAVDPAHATTLDLTLGTVAFTVTNMSPASGAANVPLSSAIAVTFSAPIDPATITPASFTVRAAGADTAGARSISADRRVVTLIPDAELASKTMYTVAVTADVRSAGGTPLTAPPPATFTTVDASKPSVPTAGQITARLPDDDGLVLVFGTVGTTEPGSAVTTANLRTQETITVLAGADGSFRSRVAAQLGDQLGLTIRNGAGQDVTFTITQFEDPDGTVGIGSSGGTIPGGDRKGVIIPRALTTAGTFKLSAADASQLPTLPAGFSYLDRFGLAVQGAGFNTLKTLTLTEAHGRFAPAVATAPPFASSASFVLPINLLVNGTVNFSAVAQDAAGNRGTAAASTLIADTAGNQARADSASPPPFPTVILTAPVQAFPNQQITIDAVAPAARVDVQIAAPASVADTSTLLLVRATAVGGQPKLAFVDLLTVGDDEGARVLRTSGRLLPGATASGQYAVVAIAGDLTFATGHITGAPAFVTVDGSPFVFEGASTNAAFIIPVAAGRPFSLGFVDAASGQTRGTTSGQAPQGGTVDLGEPLGAAAGQLTVTAFPDVDSLVDIGQGLTFTFSEAVDARTLGGIVVTGPSGSRVLGAFTISSDATRATFTPLRRWRFGTNYHYGVPPTVLAKSGARLSRPFNGEFTTFAPKVLATVPVDNARDVAVAGPVAVVGDDDGLTVLDVTQPDQPVVKGQLPLDGGASGVALQTAPNLVDRNGQPVGGPVALAVSGNATDVGKLSVVGLTALDAPAIVGSADLTVPAGRSPPANVPNAPGVPSSVAFGANARAFAAVKGIGVESATLSQAIPPNPSAPGAALGPRYPASTLGSANQVFVLDDRLLVAGDDGLTILKADTLQKLGSISTSGSAAGVAGLKQFGLDVNADGTIDSTEIFDLAVVANGADGTLQFYNIADPAAPKLVNLVRLGHPANSVALSADERVAYVAMGTAGVAFVDMAGQASIQPLDIDRDGVDDRVLGSLAVAGAVTRLSLGAATLLYGASQNGGFVSAQVTPPRIAITDLLRTPLHGTAQGQESIAGSREAFTTDDSLTAKISVTFVPDAGIAVTLSRVGSEASAGTLKSVLGSVVHVGESAIVFQPAFEGVDTDATFDLHVVSAGADLTEPYRLTFRSPIPKLAAARRLTVFPEILHIPADAVGAQVAVGAVLDDGRVANVTSHVTGTAYAIRDAVIASIDADGAITAGGGGTTALIANNLALELTSQIIVEHDAVLTRLRAEDPYLVATALSQQLSARIDADYSDGTSRDLSGLSGVSWTSSNPSVATVDQTGTIVTAGEGVATIAASFAGHSADAQISVEVGHAPTITGITFDEVESTSTAETSVALQVHITGQGALQGVLVSFDVAGTPAGNALSDYLGSARISVAAPAVAGVVPIRARVTDPATGSVLAATSTLRVRSVGTDSEPNDDNATAAALNFGTASTGSLNATSDAVDSYAIHRTDQGPVAITVAITGGFGDGDVTLIVTDAAGNELARASVGSVPTTVVVSAVAGDVFVTLRASRGAGTYSLHAEPRQDTLAITNVSPLAGSPGATVTVLGTGFSPRASDNLVFFGSFRTKVVAATPTQLIAAVPAMAVNAPVRVIVGDREAVGPLFTTGVIGPPAPATLSQPSFEAIRRDPASGTLLFVNRLLVVFDPVIDRATVDGLANAAGATVAGIIPTINCYVFEYPSVSRIEDLQAKRKALAADARVSLVALSTLMPAARALDQSFDSAKPSSRLTSRARTVGAEAYEQIEFFGAVRAIARDLAVRPRTLSPVTIAVLDTGFDAGPANPGGKNPDFANVTEFTYNAATKQMTPTPTFVENDATGAGHGTEVSSVIASLNNGHGINGIATWCSAGVPGCSIVTLRVYSVFDKRDKNAILEWVYAALSDIQQANQPPSPGVDVVNMSFGGFGGDDAIYKLLFESLRRRTLVVAAAGNDSKDASGHLPSALSTQLDNVMSIGAVAVSDTDLTGEGRDSRAVFPRPRKPELAYLRNCDSGSQGGSNCGSAVSLAAPGEDVLALLGGTFGPIIFDGTSAAAPLVSGVAAILQSLSPPTTRFTPRELRNFLISGGDDISKVGQGNGAATTWGNPGIRRLNALASVRQVLQGGAVAPVFVAEQATTVPNELPKTTLALDFDHETGSIGSAKTLTVDASTVVSGAPNGLDQQGRSVSLAVSTTRDEIYSAIAGSTGQGILVISTNAAQIDAVKPVAYIPVPGVTLVERNALALSRDSRMLFIATASGLRLVSLDERRLINSFDDCPEAYQPLQPGIGVDLATKLQTLNDELVRNGRTIVGLSISADGKVLNVAVVASSSQVPGRIVAVDIGLSADPGKAVVGDTSATRFLNVLDRFAMPATGGPGDGPDRPVAIAASAEYPSTATPSHVYLVHGGARFDGITGAQLAAQVLVKAASVVRFLLDYANASWLPSFDEQVLELINRINDGEVLIEAPGLIGTFAAGSSDPVDSFGTAVRLGSRRGTTDERDGVFGKRPFDITIRQNGGRAILPLFATGNFAVLDRNAQNIYPRSVAAGGATPADAFFQGVAAVTQSIALDATQWPKDPRDLALMYPVDAKYVQGGRFVLASHAGTSGHAACATGKSTDPGCHQAGSVSVIDDDAISRDLNGNLGASVPQTVGPATSFFSKFPLCTDHAPLSSACSSTGDLVTHYRDYSAQGTRLEFVKPGALASAPPLTIESPAFGDRITPGKGIVFRWSDSRVTRVVMRLSSIDSQTGNEKVVNTVTARRGLFGTLRVLTDDNRGLPTEVWNLSERRGKLTLSDFVDGHPSTNPQLVLIAGLYRLHIELWDDSNTLLQQPLTYSDVVVTVDVP